LKVLLCTRAFAPKVGGQETIIMLLAQGLSADGSIISGNAVQLTLVTPTPADGMNDAALGFQIVRQPSVLTLFRLLRQTDVVHLAGPMLFPLIFGLILRKPVVIEHHGFQAICPNGQLFLEPDQSPCPGHFMAGRHRECIRCNIKLGAFGSVKMWLLTFPRRWLCNNIEVNILPTKWLGTVLRLNRMKVIVHGLPPTAAITVNTSTPAPPTFVFMGRLVSTKGTRVLLEAAKQLKLNGTVFHVKIIGQGPDRSALEQMAHDLGIEDCVQFRGYVPAENLEDELRNVTAVVMPSIAGEVFGLAAAENMQRGRLLIVSNIGALAEVVGDAGMKFVPSDATELASCMQTAIANPKVVEVMRADAVARIARCFQFSRMIEEHLRTYQELHSR
jgi:glycosyltransferase involved in cell wall biosynthesis